MKRKGLLAAFILGLVFGIALGPCTFAYMAPMLAVTFKLAATNFLYGAALLLAYGVGHCAVIVAAGTSTELVQRFLNWNEHSKGVAGRQNRLRHPRHARRRLADLHRAVRHFRPLDDAGRMRYIRISLYGEIKK